MGIGAVRLQVQAPVGDFTVMWDDGCIGNTIANFQGHKSERSEVTLIHKIRAALAYGASMPLRAWF